MIGRLKGDWEEFKESKPGERFKDRYRRRQQEPGHMVKRIVLVILGSVIAVGSLFTAPLPGPGFATVFLGLAILAGELLPAARLLDWSEVRLRQLWQFVQAVWRSGLFGKIAVVVVAAILAGAFLYAVYLLLFAR
ncbi:MAG: hypothetical protein M3533_11110 [Actinomycetota bacterium]|nr:hypothetical protein [Actinomycetota bacterium]